MMQIMLLARLSVMPLLHVGYVFGGLTYEHVLPLNLPHSFYLMIFTDRIAIYCFYWDMSAGSCGPKKQDFVIYFIS